MKIALYVPSWPPGYASNGIVTYASYLVPALRSLGHRVFVVTADKARDSHDPEYYDLKETTSSPNLWHRALYKVAPALAGFKAISERLAASIKALVEEHRLDVFEIEESGGWSYAVSRAEIVPVVVRLHGPWFLTGRFSDLDDENPFFSHRQKFEGRSIGHAHLITASCEDTLNSVKNHYNLTLTNSRIIRTPIEAAPEAKTWDFESAENAFLFVGRFDKLKGGDLVLRAFAELAKSRSDVRLTFVGPDKGVRGGQGEVLHFSDFVRKYIPETVRSRIEFLGQMEHSELMALRAKRYGTIVASQYETMGYVILEAMSRGCPLVTTAVGGIPEFIKDFGNGLLVPPQNIKAMVAACEKLLSDKTLAARLGRQAWLDCREYAPDKIAKETITAYEQAIDEFKFRKK